MKTKNTIFVNRRRILYAIFGVLFLGTVLSYVGMFVLFAWFAKDLPTPTKVVRREGYASQIFDRNGELLYDVYKEAKRTPVTWEQVPDYLKKATVAIEDKDFYKHGGFDPLTPLRILKNLVMKQRLIGGSTLTQQLVKNVLLTTERTMNRKIKELILAIQIDAKYKKEEILLMYLNETPYGGPAWGVGAASEQYFGKPVSELNLVECAILAGLPQRPNTYSPFSKTPRAYIDRTQQVLTRMVQDGYLDAKLAEETLALAAKYDFYENKTSIMSPHFVFWVKEQLSERYGEDVVEGGGLKVYTTLDLKLQNEVQKIISEEIDKAEKLDISNGAAVIIDPKTGQVLSMVGSRGYFSDKTDGKFNVVTQGLRQPGSAIKPVTYLTALKKGWTPGSMIIDAPVTFEGSGGQKAYSPQNYNGKYNGPMSIRTALGNSINTTAVKMLANVGLQNMLQTAFEMGMTTLEPSAENLRKFGLAVTLGGAEVKMIDLAAAYSSFANGGKKIDLVGVLKVEDRNGRVLEEYKQVEFPSVMTAEEAFLISNILSDNSAREITFGRQNALVIPNYQVAVKTGTTNDKRDNWAIGWTPNLTVAVWVGNNNNSPMGKIASGVSGASPIWRRIMLYELPNRPKEDFVKPEKVISLEVDKLSGFPAHDGYATKTEYYIEGTQPNNPDPIHMKLKLCRGVNGLATPDDVQSGNYEEKEFIKLAEDDPVSKDGKNRWQEGIDSWINQQTEREKYFPPSDFCRSDGLVNVGIDSPGHRSTVGSTFDVRIKTNSVKKIVEVKLWADGVEKKSWTEKPYEVSLSLPDGTHKLKVKATDKDGNSQEREADIGVNVPWDWTPSPVLTATPLPTVTVAPTAVPTAAPTTIPTAAPTVLPTATVTGV
jgi:1A family penicillin-binding protein